MLTCKILRGERTTHLLDHVLGRRQAPHAFVVIIEVKEGRLPEIREKINALGLENHEPMELDNPPRTDWSFTDFDGHRIVLFEIHPKKKRVIGGQATPAEPPAAGA